MYKKCEICKKEIDLWRPYKLIQAKTYCVKCYEIKYGKSLSTKLMEFLRPKKEKFLIAVKDVKAIHAIGDILKNMYVTIGMN